MKTDLDTLATALYVKTDDLLIRHCIRVLAAGTSGWTDDVWVVDSTPHSEAGPTPAPSRLEP